MSIGLITITHNRIGREIVAAARQILGPVSTRIGHVDVAAEAEPVSLGRTLREALDAIDTGDGVLILTDLYGSTPCNVARSTSTDHAVRVVSGLNLAMVLRILNYPHLDLERAAGCAVAGGQRGIVESRDGE